MWRDFEVSTSLRSLEGEPFGQGIQFGNALEAFLMPLRETNYIFSYFSLFSGDA